jgi:uncharacterized protein with HEPN domain
MAHDARTLLEDIKRAVELIRQFSAGRSQQDYGADELLRAGVERQFIIIGEALSRLEKLDAALTAQITNQRQVIGFRNILVHGYEAIDDAIVWQVVQSDVPLLGQEAEKLVAGL